jgi:phage gp45-like
MATLYDNTEIPSYLGIEPRGEGNEVDLLTNYILRVGEVRDIIYPTDKRSIGKLCIEYEVEVQHRDGIGVATSSIYRGVTASTAFGGLADKINATFRKDTTSSDTGVGNGSKVLLLCLSGDQSKGIILGGFDDRKEKATNQGHVFEFEFNGAQFHVDNDGQIEIAFRGKTNADGSLADSADPNAEGAKILFEKDGSVTIQTNGQNRGQYIKLDHTNKIIEMSAASDFVVDSEVVTVTSTDGMFLESTDSSVSIQSRDGLQVGSANEAFILGTTYRQNEGQMNQLNSKMLGMASTLLQTAGTTLQTAAALNAVPMVGGIMAMPSLIAVATAIMGASQALNTASNNINQFENNFSDYLSKRNFGD